MGIFFAVFFAILCARWVIKVIESIESVEHLRERQTTENIIKKAPEIIKKDREDIKKAREIIKKDRQGLDELDEYDRVLPRTGIRGRFWRVFRLLEKVFGVSRPQEREAIRKEHDEVEKKLGEREKELDELERGLKRDGLP